jgi:hypothetical protein
MKQQVALAALSPVLLILGVLVHELGHAGAIIATGGTFYAIAIEGPWQGVCYGTFNHAYSFIVYPAGGIAQSVYYFGLMRILKEPAFVLGQVSAVLYAAYELALSPMILSFLASVLEGAMVIALFARVYFEFDRWLKNEYKG